MPIAAIHFTKINAERKNPSKGKIEIKNQAQIVGLEKKDFKLPNQESLVVKFDFNVKYEPDIAKINLSGEVVLIEEAAKADEILKGWEKNKQLPKELMSSVLNGIIVKSNVEATIIAKELGLPPTVKMPKVNIK